MAENGLYDVLRMGISSLRAQSRAIETVGRNMANVNNPTYSRQRVIFGDVSPTGGASVGVDNIEVQQVRDVLLDRQVVREESGVDGVVAVGWPQTPAGAGGVEAFLQAEGPQPPDLKEKVDRRLPVYMAPRRYHFLASFPLNANGKFDRNALLKLLESNP